MKHIWGGILLIGVLQGCSREEAAAPPPEAPAPKVVAAPDPNEVIRDNSERLFQNPFDADAVYFLSQKNGTRQALSVLIKRVSQDGTQYSRWVFNCQERSAQNFGVAASIQALDSAANSLPSKPQRYEPASRLGAIAGAVCQ